MKCLVVGCGLSGAVVARQLAEKNIRVTILEKRSHIAGNLYDFVDEHGILVHKYGPHTFHTNDKELFNYISKFHQWEPYALHCGAEINGLITPTPFNFKTIDQFFDSGSAFELKKNLKRYFGNRRFVTVLEVLGSPDKLIRNYGEFLFENDYRLYTAKQWGMDPSFVDPSILKRVPLRLDYSEGYFDDVYQVMPKESYCCFFEELLNHPNIDVNLETNALDYIYIDQDTKDLFFDGIKVNFPVVYTGQLDVLFKFKFGILPYRSLRFEWKHEDRKEIQPYAVVAYPQERNYTRIVEFNKLPLQICKGTTYEIEFPEAYIYGANMEPYYPVLTQQSQNTYLKYSRMANSMHNLFCCGRLADFKYYNMDQALKAALAVAEIIVRQYNL